MIETILALIGLKWLAVVSGLAGSVASLKLEDPGTVMGRLTTVGFGWLVAAFTAALAVELASMNEKHLGSVGFIVGLFALPAATNVRKAIPDLIDWWKKRPGGSNGTADR